MYRIEAGGPVGRLAKGGPAVRRDGASQGAAAQPDHAEMSAEDARRRADTFVARTKDRVVHMKVDELKAVASECPKILALPGLDGEGRSRVHLMAAAAYGLLAKQKIDRRSNAGKAFKEVRTAYYLAPDSAWCSNSYARALVAIDNLNFFLKPLATAALKIDLKSECRRVIPSLAKHPDDPMATLLRVEMAEIAKDKKARAEAQAQVKVLAERNPEGMRKAEHDIGGDAKLAKDAKDEGK